MVCPKCNGQQDEGLRFCPDCGLFLEPFDAETEKDIPLASTPLDAASADEAQDPRINQVFEGKYKLVTLLGEGGMGKVYVARRLYIGDTVAIKILLTKHFADEEVVERFRREAIAAASIRHPNIVSIYDAGGSFDESAPPYIVMELVAGMSLDKLLKLEGKLAPERAAWLMRDICAGVGAAHRHKIWHRDLKPANILVLPPYPDEGRENETIKIIDFGIAKLRKLDIKALTVRGMGALGSPPYMAPEQWREGEADARSDVYNLGITLYEMLSGAPPFVSTTREDLGAQHLYRPPPPLSPELAVPRRLEAVIMRALEKDPEARQQTVADFACDVQAALAGHVAAPVNVVSHDAPPLHMTASPLNLSGAKNGTLWWGVALAMLFVVSLLAFGSIMMFLKADLLGIKRNDGPATPTPTPTPATTQRTALSGVAPLGDLQLRRELFEVAVSPDGQVVGSVADGEPEARLWRVQGLTELPPLKGASKPGQCIAISPDGKTIASGNSDGLVRLWRMGSTAAPTTLRGHSDGVFLVKFSRDGSRLVSASLDGTIRLWGLSDGKQIDSFVLPVRQIVVNIDPNNMQIALYGSDNELRLWQLFDVSGFAPPEGDLSGFRQFERSKVNQYKVMFGLFSPDGKVLAVGSEDKKVRLWWTHDGSLMRTLGEFPAGVSGAVFSPDGRTIITGRDDGVVQMWNASGALLKGWEGHKKAVRTLSFSGDGKVLATGSADGHIRLWEVKEEL